ncbi:MAG: phosphate ABC transporter permease PstA [Pseudomonadota bacterium]
MTDAPITPGEAAVEARNTGARRMMSPGEGARAGVIDASRAARSARTRKRFAAERRFRFYGLAAVLTAFGFLALLMSTVVGNAIPAFTYHYVTIDVDLAQDDLTAESASSFDFRKPVRDATLALFPEITDRREKRAVRGLVSTGAPVVLRGDVAGEPELIGETRAMQVPVSDTVDLYLKGLVDSELPESQRNISDAEIALVDQLVERGAIERKFNTIFLTGGASREPEMAGIMGALIGSLLTLSITLLLSAPVGILAAIYLEEFAPKNRLTDFIEVNINNLAAVPSIVFGLLGLAVFLNFMEFPRSAPLVGGMVLALMTLPTIIIASRAALRAVPPSIREAALGIGASKIQTVFHHVLPLAMPGMLTGTIIGMAGALGETAPLLMIGMVAFVVDLPAGVTDPATVLPVQIYMWADFPEIGFQQKTAAAIVILLLFLIAMNAIAVWLRSRFERRW